MSWHFCSCLLQQGAWLQHSTALGHVEGRWRNGEPGGERTEVSVLMTSFDFLNKFLPRGVSHYTRESLIFDRFLKKRADQKLTSHLILMHLLLVRLGEITHTKEHWNLWFTSSFPGPCKGGYPRPQSEFQSLVCRYFGRSLCRCRNFDKTF